MGRKSLKRVAEIGLITTIIPFYFLLSFSVVYCSFHHPVDLVSKELHHAATGDPHHHHPFVPVSDFCKYAHSLSPVIDTPSTQVFVVFSPIENPFLYFASFPVKENKDENLVRGPPLIVNL